MKGHNMKAMQIATGIAVALMAIWLTGSIHVVRYRIDGADYEYQDDYGIWEDGGWCALTSGSCSIGRVISISPHRASGYRFQHTTFYVDIPWRHYWWHPGFDDY
jgi:hypothetical protein